jgi:hypothetical protein
MYEILLEILEKRADGEFCFMNFHRSLALISNVALIPLISAATPDYEVVAYFTSLSMIYLLDLEPLSWAWLKFE